MQVNNRCVLDACRFISAVSDARSSAPLVSGHEVGERMGPTPFFVGVPLYTPSTYRPRIPDTAEDAMTNWLLRELDRTISRHLEKRKHQFSTARSRSSVLRGFF